MVRRVTLALAFLLLICTTAFALPRQGEVKANSLNVRSAPGGDLLGTLGLGETVTVVGKRGDWLRIEYSGGHAWVHSAFVRPVPTNSDANTNQPAPALSPAERRLAKLVREANRESVPVLAFLQRMGEIGQVDLNRAALERAMAAAQLPADNALRQLLAGTTRLRFDGRRARLDRTGRSTFKMGAGAMRLDKTVELTVTGHRDQVRISDPMGVKVGENAHDLYDLKSARFLVENGRAVAKVTAGAFVFSKTVTIDLGPTGGTAPARPGALGALEAATNR